jgi:23S rRNA (adenine2503-C2)-methyltransferase
MFTGNELTKFLIKNLTLPELKAFLESKGIEKFRAEQAFDYIYKQRCETFDDMTNIPSIVRSLLSENFFIDSIVNQFLSVSSDGTKKFLFELRDGNSIESVLIPNDKDADESDKKKRNTLCVSSQIGCSVDCAFCATGKLKLKRSLDAAEIVDQAIFAERISGEKATNIVFMGMGEPLLNYDNTVKAVRILSDGKYGLLSRKRITVSTSGIVPQIYKLADEVIKVKLAISLHATTNGLRNKLVPISRKFDLKQLGDAIEYYYRKTKIPLTYEYIPFDGLNDTEQDVKRLVKFIGRVPSKINIIPYHDIGFTNPVGFAGELKASSPDNFIRFAEALRSEGVNVFVRSSSGLDIDAACGQLAYSKRKRKEL